MTAALTLRAVTKSFGGKPALAGVDLELGEHELLVVLGPTGAGKTTLLRTIAGLTAPDGGTVSMGDRDVTALSPSARDVALVFQNFSLYPRWSVRRNLAFPLRAPGRDLTEQAIEERVRWAAELLRIEHLLERDSRKLSGGEMQRVAIGRAIVRRPRLFLMDEPLTNLDAKLRESLRVEIVRLTRELGTPMVYVTHDQAEALSMGDRIVVLSQGEVLQSGTPREVYLAPTSPEVARQLGQPAMNVLEARREGELWIGKDGSRLARAAGGSGEPVGQALLGVRPEHVSLRGGSTPGRIRVVENTGPECMVVVDWGPGTLHVLVPRNAALRPGDEVRPQLDPERVVVWSAS